MGKGMLGRLSEDSWCLGLVVVCVLVLFWVFEAHSDVRKGGGWMVRDVSTGCWKLSCVYVLVDLLVTLLTVVPASSGWCRVLAKLCAEANFRVRLIFQGLANRLSRSWPDEEPKRHAKTAKAPRGGGGWRTKSNLLRMLPDWKCPHTKVRQPKQDSHLHVKKAAAAATCLFNSIGAEREWNLVTSSKQNCKRGASRGLQLSLAVSEWLLCIVESYWLVSPPAHPGLCTDEGQRWGTRVNKRNLRGTTSLAFVSHLFIPSVS